MLFTLLGAFVFLINTVTVGYYFSLLIQYLTKQQNSNYSLLNLLLLGTMATYVYCNICSFFIGVNYITVLPLLLLAVYSIITKRDVLFICVKQYFELYQQNFFIYTLLIAALLIFLTSPPINVDSRDYHFTSIYFYEQYKVIPGLANIHGRLAFNPANFVISSAYAFTNILQQSIYPVNLVLIAVFLGWFVKKIMPQKNLFLYITGFVVMVYLLRQFFPNIASPSSDTLAIIIALYIAAMVYDIATKQHKNTYTIVCLMLCCLFGICVKISLFPLQFILPIVYLVHRKKINTKLIIGLVFFSLLLYLPWLCRNVIMSGYLVYPLINLDFFSFEWKAPKEILALDIYYIKYSPKWVDFNVYNYTINFYNWIPTWILAHAKMNRLLELPFLFSAFLSPFVWLYLRYKKIAIPSFEVMVWSVYYIGCIWWLFTSPEYRFGYTFLLVAAVYPWVYWFRLNTVFTVTRFFSIALPCMLCLYVGIAYYAHTKHARFYTNTIKQFWLYPLPDKELLKGLDNVYRIDTFKNFKVYYADMTDCIHFKEPCVGWKYGVVKPLGNGIEDGFKLIQNDVYKNYPFITPASTVY
jgi:hypothetical protein